MARGILEESASQGPLQALSVEVQALSKGLFVLVGDLGRDAAEEASEPEA